MAQVQEPVVTFDRRSTQRTRPATVAGLCYLAVIAGGLFAEGMVRGSLVVPGDARRRLARSSRTRRSGGSGSRFTSSTSSRPWR